MSINEGLSIVRREKDILERLENVKRLIEMETTIMTVEGAKQYANYRWVDSKGQIIGDVYNSLLNDLRENIQLQLLSIVALCNGDNPDVGEPCPMLEWNGAGCVEDKFRDVWEECLIWNA